MLKISMASDPERDWAARLMAASEPWVTLGLTLDECLRSCRDPHHVLYVARLDNTPRGAVLLHPRWLAGSPYVKSIAVEEGYRGRGIGAALVQFAEDLFCGKARHMFLCVSSFNQRARSFWKERGYHPVGELPDLVVDGFSEVLMHKRLR